jgi:hypothetical protein
MRYLQGGDQDMQITNLAFTKSTGHKEEMTILYASTPKAIFYYKISDKRDEYIELDALSGAYSGCIAVDEEKLVVASNIHPSIMEYINQEKGPCWFFEGKKQVKFINFSIFLTLKITYALLYSKINLAH